MMQYLLLVVAIGCEVTGTLALRAAARGRPAFYGIVVVGYLLAFTLLWWSLRFGMPLGVAYGIWSALGVAATALFSSLLFDEAFTLLMVGGLALIIGGVVLVEAGSRTEEPG